MKINSLGPPFEVIGNWVDFISAKAKAFVFWLILNDYGWHWFMFVL